MKVSSHDIYTNYLNNNASPHDYPEDGPDKVYLNICGSCESQFLGYKRRLSCKQCATEYQERLDAMSPAERKRHEEEKLKQLAELHR